MKLLYDHQIFDLQQYGGISRYFYELMSCFAATGVPKFELACPYTTNAYLWEAPFLKLNTLLTRKRFKGSGLVNNILASSRNRSAAEAAIVSGGYDLFHPTYYDPYFLEYLGSKPFVLTVHDMIHERYPECYATSDPTIGWKQLLVDNAAHIIADSQSTKSELLEFCGVNEGKVTVVHLGYSIASPVNCVSTVAPPEKYLIYVGERSRYKNFAFAVRSLEPLFRDCSDLEFLCVGGGGFDAQEIAMFAELGLTGRCRQVRLDDKTLATAYSRALALIFPSLCEGFGIPVLEAFACGCPAILSNRTSLPEVGGDAALYFDPEDGDSLLQQVSVLIADSSLREYFVAAGLKRSKEFSWQKCAMETAAVYEKVLGAGR